MSDRKKIRSFTLSGFRSSRAESNDSIGNLGSSCTGFWTTSVTVKETGLRLGQLD